MCARTLRAENNAGVAEEGREKGGDGAGGGGGEPVRQGQRRRTVGAPTRAAVEAQQSGAGTPAGELSPVAPARTVLPRVVRRVRGQVAACVREWQWLGLSPPPSGLL